MKYLFRTCFVTLIISIMYYSCDTNELITNEQIISETKIPIALREMKQFGLSYDDIGKIHNAGLSSFMKNKPKYEFTNFNSLIRDIDLELKKVKPNCPLKVNDNNYSSYNNYLSLKRKGIESLKFKDLISNIYKGKVSEKIEILFEKILDGEYNYSAVNNIVQKYLKETELTEIEKETIILFNTVAHYSNEYWVNYEIKQNRTNSISSKWDCDPRHQQFIGDAVGTIFGGLGAIGISWLVYEFQKDVGGVCI